MERYRNLNGNSNVVSFEISDDAIIVMFGDHSQYLYNTIKPGREILDQMQALARSGQGLNSYISRIVRKNYYRKL